MPSAKQPSHVARLWAGGGSSYTPSEKIQATTDVGLTKPRYRVQQKKANSETLMARQKARSIIATELPVSGRCQLQRCQSPTARLELIGPQTLAENRWRLLN
jgi:hypothetical protein